MPVADSALAAAIEASFADYRTVKSRGVLQLIMEVPIERQADVFAALGYPMPHEGIHCAVARLNLNPLATGAESRPLEEVGAGPPADPKNPHPLAGAHPKDYVKSLAAKQRYAEMDEGKKAVTRAALLSVDPEFRRWVRDTWQAEDPVLFIRKWCGIDSRRKLVESEFALAQFHALETSFAQAVGKLPEVRGRSLHVMPPTTNRTQASPGNVK